MNTVCEIDRCAGCMACVEVCSKKAIYISDSGFTLNAIIDENNCISCDRCHEICQTNNPPKGKYPMLWKQGWALNEEIRMLSSSGGIATAIAKSFICDNGIVCSCVFSDGYFKFSFVEDVEGVEEFCGSKYVKSNPAGVYNRIKREVLEKRKVLFIGLPCQVAAVENFIGDNEYLYTIDLICHGSPSPKILNFFLQSEGVNLEELRKIKFRNKSCFQLSDKDQIIPKTGLVDYYTMCFLNGTTYTENCYTCKYANIERISDITIGDSWGTELSIDEQNRGVSLILCQTKKGEYLLRHSDLVLKNVDINRAISANKQLSHPSEKNVVRSKFIYEYKKGRSFKRIVFSCFTKRYLKDTIKIVLIKLGIIREI